MDPIQAGTDVVQSGLLEKVVACVVILNVALSSASIILAKVAESFGGEGAGKVSKALASAADFIKKILDVVGANPKH